MQLQELDIPDVRLLEPARHGDERGFFSEIWNARTLARLGAGFDIVQENFSLSRERHTVRGLHFQRPPYAQDKIVQVVHGAILDVAVDLRAGSPWFGRHVAAEISADNWRQILVPAGFAHGFCTLEPDTAVIYKVSAPYSPEHDAGILWHDPALGIAWPVEADTAVVSAKDAAQPRLADIAAPFTYGSDRS